MEFFGGITLQTSDFELDVRPVDAVFQHVHAEIWGMLEGRWYLWQAQ